MPDLAATSRWAALRPALPAAGLVVAAWAVLPPYTGPDINTETRVEVADHVVPSVVMVALSLAVLLRTRRKAAPGAFPLAAGLGVLLAGIWMTATHLPLVAQARREEITGVSMGAAAWHTAPGVAVMLLGLVWAAAWWSEPTDQAEPGRPGGTAS